GDPARQEPAGGPPDGDRTRNFRRSRREGCQMRLKDKVAIVVGAGQSPGEGMGNGRATAITFAREGAKVMCVDCDVGSAQETVDMIASKGGLAAAFKADVTK